MLGKVMQFDMTGSIDEKVGQRIAHYRTKKGLTRDQLARWLGISEVNLVNLEDGRERCTGEQIVTMANVLDVMPSAFFEQANDGDRDANKR